MDCVLIVEDEPTLLTVLEAALAYGGFASRSASTGREALTLFRSGGFDAVLLDLGLPDMDGGELLRIFRSESDVPLLVISGRGSEQDRIDALDHGADDFVPKPFLPGELLARIRAALRRHPGRGSRKEVLEVDPERRRVFRGGQEVRLSGNEAKFLFALSEQLDEVVHYDSISQAVWGDGEVDAGSRIRVLVNGIRQKIEPESGPPRHLISERGIGYRLLGATTIVKGD